MNELKQYAVSIIMTKAIVKGKTSIANDLLLVNAKTERIAINKAKEIAFKAVPDYKYHMATAIEVVFYHADFMNLIDKDDSDVYKQTGTQKYDDQDYRDSGIMNLMDNLII